MPRSAMRTTSRTSAVELESLQLDFQDQSDHPVIALRGRLAGPLSAEDRARINSLARKHRRLELDLTGLNGFSGVALRKFLQYCRHIQLQGVTFGIKGIGIDFAALVEAAGFADLFRGIQSDSVTPRREMSVRIDSYPTHRHADYAMRPGSPWPFGATVLAGGINFAVFSKHAASCALVLFKPGRADPIAEIPFPAEFRVGDVFAMTVFDLDPEEFEYGYRLDGPFDPAKGHWFDRSKIVLDPMARCITGHDIWGVPQSEDRRPSYRARIVPEDFDWGSDQPLRLPLEDLVIYEAHVRGFTRHPTSGVHFPGTFAGIREKIPYLKKLGINCLELLPVFQFDETENKRIDPLTNEKLCNFWGYNTVGFYAPHAGFAATASMGTQVDELKALVKDLHRHGIEILLDVVFNHTAEGDENGPLLSFRGLDNSIYYMLSLHGEYLNFSGCGNTFNCNHPVVRDFVLNCLRYWVSEYHIDGFRFDLASILGRAADGMPLANPPLLEALAMDPILSQTKLIAEAWDAGGLYQVGTFPAYGRWAEWNGKFRDCVRKSLKGDTGQMGELAQRLIGSPDIYPTRGPTASINFVTCHDGFTLADLVSYNAKHNDANGENNRDGSSDNFSWNCGIEGPTTNSDVQALRERQMKNALTILFLSQGVPMLLMGDEVGRSQSGNNNTYCQDNPPNWLDWTLLERNHELFRFCQGLIAFRYCHRVLRRRLHAGQVSEPLGGFEVSWHGTQAGRPDWAGSSRVLALTLQSQDDGEPDVIYAAFNFYWEPLEFEFPQPPPKCQWRQFVNTAFPSPNDLTEAGSGRDFDANQKLTLAGRSIAVFAAHSTLNAINTTTPSSVSVLSQFQT